MSSSSKILTVSYGTFSCTAEGFDDPLEVVKETTHFFRGVVGEDRFFGAEPPQFDPELATEYLRDRIADGGAGGGTLSIGSPPRVRTAAASAGAMAAAFNAEPVDAAEPDDLLPDDDTIEATAVLTEKLVPEDAEVSYEAEHDVSVTDGTEAAPAPHASAPDNIAAKLDRIRAVVAQAEEEDAASESPAPEAEPVVSEPVMSEPVVSELVEPELVEPELNEPELAEHETPEPESVEPEAFEPAEVEPKAEDIEPSAALQDLQGDDTSVAENVEPESDALEDLLGELVVDSGDAEEIDLTAESLENEDDDKSLDDAVANLLADQDDEDDEEDQPESALPQAAAAAAVAALVGGGAKSFLDRDEEDDEADEFDAADAAETALDEAWAAEAAPKPEDEASDLEHPEPETAEADEVETTEFTPIPEQMPGAAPLRARVVKVKRAALEQAIDDGTLEEIVEEPAPKPAPAPASESSLTPEEEEELARELAAVKAELASDFGAWDEDEIGSGDSATRQDESLYGHDDDDAMIGSAVAAAAADSTAPAGGMAPLRLEHPVQTPGDDWNEDETAEAARHEGDEADDVLREAVDTTVGETARKAIKLASPARAMLTEQEVADDDTSRLLDQTNTELDEPEGNRRRSAIAHLRAAVAATKADRLLGRKADAAEEQEPYREDLASVVRPRRPQSGGVRQTRPESSPAPGSPLKLVADQLVKPESAPEPEPAAEKISAAPVRPRRVRRAAPTDAALAETEEKPSSGFATYAESVGAKDLPELLEAAAAYMSYVEGRDQFSRPQLMTTLRQAEVTDSSREDRLRSFGQLLREGKIRKTSGGRFTAADTISFKPDRAANG